MQPPHSHANAVALVTGAGSGLGRALSLALAAAGHAIAAVDVRPEGLAELERQLQASGSRVAAAVADVTDAPALAAGVAELERRLGPVELLIANAGIGFENSALAFSADDFAAHVNVNLVGVANSVAAVLPGMLQRQRGHLTAISSLASFRGLPKMAGYCASKAGVNALMEALRVELKPHGVFVTTICPGWIRTPLTANLKLPLPRMMEVNEAARRIVRAVGARRSFLAFPGGTAWQVRLLRWLPSGVSDWLVARLLARAERTRPR